MHKPPRTGEPSKQRVGLDARSEEGSRGLLTQTPVGRLVKNLRPNIALIDNAKLTAPYPQYRDLRLDWPATLAAKASQIINQRTPFAVITDSLEVHAGPWHEVVGICRVAFEKGARPARIFGSEPP